MSKAEFDERAADNAFLLLSYTALPSTNFTQGAHWQFTQCQEEIERLVKLSATRFKVNADLQAENSRLKAALNLCKEQRDDWSALAAGAMWEHEIADVLVKENAELDKLLGDTE